MLLKTFGFTFTEYVSESRRAGVVALLLYCAQARTDTVEQYYDVIGACIVLRLLKSLLRELRPPLPI